MENVDSCRRRRKWWSNFRSTTQCATQIWQSDRLPTPPLLPPPLSWGRCCRCLSGNSLTCMAIATCGDGGAGKLPRGVRERSNQKRQWERLKGARGKRRQSNSQEYVNYERLSAEILYLGVSKFSYYAWKSTKGNTNMQMESRLGLEMITELWIIIIIYNIEFYSKTLANSFCSLQSLHVEY